MHQRLATRADLPRLLRLMEAFYHEETLRFTLETAEVALRRLIDEPELGWVQVATTETVIVGYLAATLGYSLEFGGRYGLIDEVYIEPPYRGGGLGATLLTEMIRICRARGLVAARLEVERDNVRACRLYERLGFVKHDRDLLTCRFEPEP